MWFLQTCQHGVGEGQAVQLVLYIQSASHQGNSNNMYMHSSKTAYGFTVTISCTCKPLSGLKALHHFKFKSSRISAMQAAQFYCMSLCPASREVCCQGVSKFRDGLSGGPVWGDTAVMPHTKQLQWERKDFAGWHVTVTRSNSRFDRWGA